MTREEFESLSLNARLWAKLGTSNQWPASKDVAKADAAYFAALGDSINEIAPKFDSDDSPRWLLTEAIQGAKAFLNSNPLETAHLKRAIEFDRAIRNLGAIAKADDLAAAVESVLPLPEWVTE